MSQTPSKTGNSWIFSHNFLTIAIALGALFGGIFGWAWGQEMLAIAWLGDIFLNGLRLLVVPLVMLSLTAGICQLHSIRRLGPLGLRTILYFMSTTAISVVIGLVFVNLFQPGAYAGALSEISQIPEKVSQKGDFSFTDVLINMIPPNLFQAMAEGNIMPLILFSLAFGSILISMEKKAKPLIDLILVANEIILRMVKYFMVFAPIGIFALVAGKLGASGGGDAFWLELKRVGMYSLTVILALGTHGLIVLPAILFFFRKKCLTYLVNGIEAFVTAFGTASSSATLPITLRCVEKKNKVHNEVAGFVCSLGSTINMDGTALYEAIAAMFIAQAYGIELSLAQQILIFLTATLASIGAAGIPQAGLVTMVMVLNAVNLPLEGIGMLLAVDWFLDRCRTTVNVCGDMVGAGVIDHLLFKKNKA